MNFLSVLMMMMMTAMLIIVNNYNYDTLSIGQIGGMSRSSQKRKHQ